MTDLPPGVAPMRNVTLKFDRETRDWLLKEAAERQLNFSEATRFWLRLAYKYRRAIYEAENAPVSFVRDRRATTPT